MAMRRVRVLALDGGGIRGIIPAKVLSVLEQLAERPVVELFDVIVGTSIGGIAALALVLPRDDGPPAPASEIGEFYTRNSPTIFPKAPVAFPRTREDLRELISRVGMQAAIFGSNPEWGNARYSPEGIEHALRDQFGEAHLSDALIDVVVTAYDIQTSSPMLFRSADARSNPDADFLMRDVARATSAAPTAFPPLHLKTPDGTDHILIDGGIFANNPAMIAYGEAMRLAAWRGFRFKGIDLVSIGTGLPPDEEVEYEEFISRSWLRLAEDIFEAANRGQCSLYDSLLRSLLEDHYTRFQSVLPAEANFAMDDASEANIAALRDTADRLVEERIDDLTRLARELSPKG